jgi:hypothetical protein
MKKAFLSFVLFVSVYSLYGQGINYQSNYNDALSLAAKSTKPLFLLITGPADSAANHTSFTTGLESKKVAGFYNNKFINYQINIDNPDAAKIKALFNPQIFPYCIFLDYKGQVVYKTGESTTATPERYLYIAKQALKHIPSGNKVVDKRGNHNADQVIILH